ncbi:MAG: RNA-binding protein [Puniceicoccales bacterium]|jgi:RNA recognition motif-containing protein|nr:RNA-binding protein [Puniceicoccales bacterium]
MDNKLFVGNLAWGAAEEDLQQYFGQFGKIQQIEVMRDRFTNRARGFAFVTFETPEEALAAANNTEGKDFMGRPLKVNVARPREDRPQGERRFSDNGPRGGGSNRGGSFRPRRSFNGGGGERGGSGYGDRPRRRFDRDDRGNRGGGDYEGSSGGYHQDNNY